MRACNLTFFEVEDYFKYICSSYTAHHLKIKLRVGEISTDLLEIQNHIEQRFFALHKLGPSQIYRICPTHSHIEPRLSIAPNQE